MRRLKLTTKQLATVLSEDDDNGSAGLLGHPVGGVGGSEYNPQTMDQHKRTFRAFNKNNINEGGVRVDFDTFKEEVKSFIKHLLEKPMNHTFPAFWKKLGVDYSDLIKEMAEVGLITWYTPNGKIEYMAYKEGFDKKVEELYQNLSSDMDETMSEDENVQYTEPEEPTSKDYELVHMNEEIAIFRKDRKALLFYYENLSKEELEAYAEVPIKPTGHKDEEGFMDYDKEDFDIDGSVIERYVNDNIHTFDFGYGLEGYSNGDDMVVVTNKLKDELISTYPNDEKLETILNGGLQTEVTGAEGSSGSFVTKMGGDDKGTLVRRHINNQYSPSSQINEQEINEPKEEEKGTVEFEKEMEGEEEFDLNGKKFIYVWVKDADGDSKMGVYCYDNDEAMTFDEFYRNNFKSVDEATGAAGSSGAYVQPKVWANNKSDMRHGQSAWYPSGQIVQNPMKEDQHDTPQYAGGGFVEFDDCTKLNNNKEAQKGGCSQGAKDNVVKVKKKKGGGIVADQKVYNEIARRTGRTIDEVKEIIEKKGDKV